MLALLEACVSEAGGTFAFCDTDSMAIVAREERGLVPCPGGHHRDSGGRDAHHRLIAGEPPRTLWVRVSFLRGVTPEQIRHVQVSWR